MALVPLAKVTARAADRATGPQGHHQVRDAALGRLPDLRPGGQVVRIGVGRVGVLVRLPGAGRLARDPVRDAVVGALVVRVDVGWADHHLRAIGAQQGALLLRLLVGHDEDAPIALDRRRHGQADPGVAAGRLHDHATRLQQPGPLRRLDHGQRDPVLDRSARIHVLQLADDARRHAIGQAVEGHQWGAADGRRHIGQDAALSQRLAPSLGRGRWPRPRQPPPAPPSP